VPLIQASISDFRCIAKAELELGSSYNLIVGPNAAGKTSILEAIVFLGRGRSFRGSASAAVVRHGCEAFVVTGRRSKGERNLSAGVQGGREGLVVQVDGQRGVGAAGLAEFLPLQLIDPDVHSLVAGGPEERRRYLDWIGFHVEQGYLDTWRRFRRSLRQRNAALRDGAGPGEMRSWNHEFAEAATALDARRTAVVDEVSGAVRQSGQSLLGGAVDIDYRRGWPAGATIDDVLEASLERDRALGQTSAGPHRADLRLVYDERQARKLVSRGQQKLLACSMVLAASSLVQQKLGAPLLLLLDDPAAELDSRALGRLMGAVAALGCQVLATALVPDERLFPAQPRLFHVEQGVIHRS
jgi:DNA replication and repair protein RecF